MTKTYAAAQPSARVEGTSMMPGENNNVFELTTADLHRTLHSLNNAITGRPNRRGLARVYFKDGPDIYRLLLQPNNLGFNVSATLNGAVSYQLNRTIFGGDASIGNVLMEVAAAPAAGTTAEEFFSN